MCAKRNFSDFFVEINNEQYLLNQGVRIGHSSKTIQDKHQEISQLIRKAILRACEVQPRRIEGSSDGYCHETPESLHNWA